MGKTAIEWADVTWNVVTGCRKISPGCKHCYAERLFPRVYPGRDFTDVQCHPARLEQPLRWRKPRHVFVNSMSDLFHEAVPDAFLDQVFAVMALSPQHVFQILTKRPERMRRYMDTAPGRVGEVIQRLRQDSTPVIPCPHLEGGERWWPLSSVWLGVSAEDQEHGDARIPVLLDTPAAVRFVSAEPLLGPIDLTKLTKLGMQRDAGNATTFNALHAPLRPGSPGHPGGLLYQEIDWVIVGGESGPRARPMHPTWARALRDQCRENGIPFFMKQMTRKTEIPQDLFVREFPDAIRKT